MRGPENLKGIFHVQKPGKHQDNLPAILQCFQSIENAGAVANAHFLQAGRNVLLETLLKYIGPLKACSDHEGRDVRIRYKRKCLQADVKE